jgi:hypothetical protein
VVRTDRGTTSRIRQNLPNESGANHQFTRTSRSSVVTVMQSTQSRTGKNRVGSAGQILPSGVLYELPDARGPGDRSAHNGKAAVSGGSRSKRSHVQQAPAALDRALRNIILPRAFEPSTNTLDPHRPDHIGSIYPILRISITDKEPGSRLTPGKLPAVARQPWGLARCRVTLKWRIRRQSEPMMNKPYRKPSIVGTVKKAHRSDGFAMIA